MNVCCGNQKRCNARAEMHSNFSDQRILSASEVQVVYFCKLPKSSVYIMTPCAYAWILTNNLPLVWDENQKYCIISTSSPPLLFFYKLVTYCLKWKGTLKTHVSLLKEYGQRHIRHLFHTSLKVHFEEMFVLLRERNSQPFFFLLRSAWFKIDAPPTRYWCL